METKEMLNETTENEIDLFDPRNFKFDPDAPREKTIYHLRKAIIAICKKKGLSNKISEDIATRNLDHVLAQILNSEFSEPESAPQSVMGANATVIKGNPL
jgi:hypothetical protein